MDRIWRVLMAGRLIVMAGIGRILRSLMDETGLMTMGDGFGFSAFGDGLAYDSSRTFLGDSHVRDGDRGLMEIACGMMVGDWKLG
jgi:hypothetical protein